MKHLPNARYCLKGHLVNPSVIRYPGLCQDDCPVCASQTITRCSSCEAPIRYFNVAGEGFLDASPSVESAPNYCFDCGHPFPWARDLTKSNETVVRSLTLPSTPVESEEDLDTRILEELLKLAE